MLNRARAPSHCSALGVTRTRPRRDRPIPPTRYPLAVPSEGVKQRANLERNQQQRAERATRRRGLRPRPPSAIHDGSRAVIDETAHPFGPTRRSGPCPDVARAGYPEGRRRPIAQSRDGASWPIGDPNLERRNRTRDRAPRGASQRPNLENGDGESPCRAAGPFSDNLLPPVTKESAPGPRPGPGTRSFEKERWPAHPKASASPGRSSRPFPAAIRFQDFREPPAPAAALSDAPFRFSLLVLVPSQHASPRPVSPTEAALARSRAPGARPLRP